MKTATPGQALRLTVLWWAQVTSHQGKFHKPVSVSEGSTFGPGCGGLSGLGQICPIPACWGCSSCDRDAGGAGYRGMCDGLALQGTGLAAEVCAVPEVFQYSLQFGFFL